MGSPVVAERVLRADADRSDWLRERRKRICSSDVAAILGVSPYHTALKVWYEKNERLPDEEESEQMLWGTLHEETIAREWARRNRSAIQRLGLLQRLDKPWMGATLDRLVLHCPLDQTAVLPSRNCFLEVKHRDKMTASRWTAGCPDDVHAQVAWAMAVTGYDHGHVAVLLGGNDYRQFVIRRDPQLEADMINAAGAFRTSLAAFDEDQARLVYGVDPEETVTIDNALHPDRSGYRDLDQVRALEAFGALESYQRATRDASNAKVEKDVAKAKLVGLLGGQAGAKIDGELFYTYEPGTRRTCDLERLLEHHPDAYRDCVTTTISPTLRLKKPAKTLYGGDE